MLAEVVRPFKDRYTGACYASGAVIEVTEERFAEITQRLGDAALTIAQADPDPLADPLADEQAQKTKKR